MTDQELRGLTRAVRFLGTLSGIVLISLGYAVWRFSSAWLAIYRDFNTPVTWRHQALACSGSSYVFASVAFLGAAIVLAAWRLPSHAMARILVVSVLLTWILLIAAAGFYFDILNYPTTSMCATTR